MASDNERLRLDALKQRGIAEKLARLFDELETDHELQEMFIDNPVGVIDLKVHGRQPQAEEVSAGNRFLYSALTNKNLRNWSKEYARYAEENRLDEATREQDWAKALLEHGDVETIIGLQDLAKVGRGDILDKATAILKSDSYYTERADSSTSTKTDEWFAVKVSSDGKMTEFEERILTLSAAKIRSVVDRMVARAQVLREQGALKDATRKIF